MTENNTQDTVVAAAIAAEKTGNKKCGMGKNCRLRILVGLGIAFCLGVVAFLQNPGVQPWLTAPRSTVDITAINHRLDGMAAKLNALTEIASAAHQDDNAALAADIKILQAQVAELQNQKNAEPDAARAVGMALALWALRDVSATSRPFSAQLAALVQRADGDAFVREQAAKIEPLAAFGVPRCEDLRTSLIAAETAADAVPDSDAPAWLQRLQIMMRPVIAFHHTRDPGFAAVEQALAENDARQAADEMNALPQNIRSSMADWEKKLQARVMLDDVMDRLAEHFAALTREEP